MKKIPTIFVRDSVRPSVVSDVKNPACQWVFDGEGRPTRKWDGTACMIRDGELFKRYDCKNGRVAPAGAIPCDDPDPVTGHWPHWVRVGDGPEDSFHREAYKELLCRTADGKQDDLDGTYELIHPRFQGRDSSHINPEHVESPVLVRHGADIISGPIDLTHASFRSYFNSVDYEGIVWFHPDGRMAKIKARDFGVKRI